jgi:YggT family protein
MFILSNLVSALAVVIKYALTFFQWLIFARALLSWVSPDPGNPIVQFLERTTDPILTPIRRMLPPMAIDISPIIAFLIILFLQQFLVQSLYDLAFRIH